MRDKIGQCYRASQFKYFNVVLSVDLFVINCFLFDLIKPGVGNLSLAAGQNYNLQSLSGPYKFAINSVVVKTCEYIRF